MKKGSISAIIDKEQNVNVGLDWKDDKEMYFLTASLFSTMIKTLGKEKVLQLVEEGDRLKKLEES